MGGGSTLWEGTAFDCFETEDSILLRHSLFGSGGITGQCNNGAITGQSIGVENECYTSQLNVTVDPTLNKRTVRCTHTSLIRTTIGETTLTVIEGRLLNIYNNELQGLSSLAHSLNCTAIDVTLYTLVLYITQFTLLTIK